MNRSNRHNPVGRMQAVRNCLKAAPLAAIFSAAVPAEAQNWDSPQSRMRPLGSPSAVDAYRGPTAAQTAVQQNFERTASAAIGDSAPSTSTSYVRQAAMMQASDGGFSMPPISSDAAPSAGSAPSATNPAAPSMAMPAPLTQSPALPPIAPPSQYNAAPPPQSNAAPPPQNNIAPPPQSSATPLPRPNTMAPPAVSPPANPPSGLAPVPRSAPSTAPAAPVTTAPQAAAGDYAPLAQPQLSTQFATMGNCRNITPPSGYRSDRILTCGPPVSYVTTVGASAPPPTYIAPPAQIGPPVTLPPATLPAEALPLPPVQTVIPGSPGFRPLISFGQERYPVQVGQGIFGQPTAYVPGQSFRNAIRYLTW